MNVFKTTPRSVIASTIYTLRISKTWIITRTPLKFAVSFRRAVLKNAGTMTSLEGGVGGRIYLGVLPSYFVPFSR